MLIMLTVLAFAALFATDVTNASANRVHHKRTHKVYKKKKAKKRHVAKKAKHKKKARKAKKTSYKKPVAKKANKTSYKKPAAKKTARKVVKKVTRKKARKTSFAKLYSAAARKLGHPYVYGAVGPYSFDCSGFTRYIYRHGAHKNLARTAQMQYNTNKHVSRKHIKKGDLVFFGQNRSSITHVGMYIGHDRMIDAQNRGVITEKIHVNWWHAVGYARVA